MAAGNDLTLKVSQQEYNKALDALTTKLSQMETNYEKLVGMEERIRNNYKGAQADKAIEAIQANKDKVREAIEDVRAKKESIEKALGRFENRDTEIKAGFEDAIKLAQSVYGD